MSKSLPLLSSIFMWELIDTHAHLNLKNFDKDLEEVVKRAQEQGVKNILNVGIDLKTSVRAIELAYKFEGLWAAVGIHPHEVKYLEENSYQVLKRLLREPKVKALGEIGLDYVKEYSPKSLQKEHFLKQLLIAKEKDLPVIIHSRGAEQAIIDIIKDIRPNKFVFHCYSGTLKEAQEILDLGGYISITGIVTFPKAENLRKVVEFIPLDKIFIETDCPFLTPVPYRGRRNEPAYVFYVLKAISQIKKISMEECAKKTTENAKNFFGI